MVERRLVDGVKGIPLGGAFLSQATTLAKKKRPRTCSRRGCNTVLSIYNKTKEVRCASHEIPKY